MRILVADDEDLVIELLERSLKLDKHIVESAKDGPETIKKVLHNSYDVIILDIIMPGLNGIEVCKRLRKKGIHTPIIMLTSRVGEDAQVKGLDSGADDYLTKPYSYKELEARIRAVTRRPKTVRDPVIQAGPLSLDTNKKVILLEDDVLELRPKEYALLDYMMHNIGTVISKDELLKNVWRISANNASNRLEVCMYHIRRKVNKKQPVLKTVRGYGYVIDGNKAS